MKEFNLPVKDDAPWLDCMDGFKETQAALDIAKEGIQLYKEALKSMTDQAYPDEMFEEAERREAENKRPFYRFFAVDYFATGEGISHWLKVCRNYDPCDSVDHDMERFKKFVEYSHYFSGIEELTEEEFMTKYVNLIPSHMVKMIERKDQPCLDWETHYHVNYS